MIAAEETMDTQTVTLRELLEEKITALRQDVYTFRKQVLGNGQPGDLDRIRGVIRDTGGRCDTRNGEIWKAVDEIREKYVPRSDYEAVRKDVEDLKRQRWIWVGALTAIFGAIELAAHFVK